VPVSNNGLVDTAALVKQIEREGAMKPLGWRVFDDGDFGLNPGEIAIVAGRPGHGKTTVLLNMMVNWLTRYPDETFVLISHEVPVEAVMLKLLSILTRRRGRTGWSYNELRRLLRSQLKEVPPGLEADDALGAIAELREVEKRMRIVYEPNWRVDDVCRYLVEVKSNTNIGGVFVDYLQLIGGKREDTYESRDHEMSMVAKNLKRCAVEAEAPMVVAAQITRDVALDLDFVAAGSLEDERVVQHIMKRRPQLNHVGEGGGDQEADLVLGILNYRAEFVAAAEAEGSERLIVNGDSNPFEILVLKNRYGRLITAPLIIELRSGYIRDPGVFGK
jgi:replicative DNA helicase